MLGWLLASLVTPAFADDSADTTLSPEQGTFWIDDSLPDQSDWSNKRISRYDLVDYEALGPPAAIIRIPDVAVNVPVYPDSAPLALEAGAAWVSSTTRPGNSGNVAVAGHRDSFFRPLEGIPEGTRIELTTADSRQVFSVESVEIVDALDVSPLLATDRTSLTLITCHPFRYQGFAPDRYIVRAVLIEQSSFPQTEPALQTSEATF